MAEQYEVMFFGTSKTGVERNAVKDKVRAMFKLSEEQVDELFGTAHGVVLALAPDQEKAQFTVNALLRAGASANWRQKGSASGSDWSQWELEAVQEVTRPNRFRCVACDHSFPLKDDQDMPDVCPECDVVQSKYDAVAAKKAERERIRNNLLAAKKAQAQRAEDERERLRLEALRKEVEKELRKEFAEEYGRKSKLQILGAAGATFVIGIASALGFSVLTAEPVGEEPPMAQVTPATMAGQTLTIANDLIARLPVSPSGPLSLAAEDTMARLDDVPQQFPSLPVPSVGEPGPPIETTGDWYEDLQSDPLAELHVQQAMEKRIGDKQFHAAEQVVGLADQPVKKLALQARLASALQSEQGDVENRSLAHAISFEVDRVELLEHKVTGMLALEALDNSPVPDTSEARLEALFKPVSIGTLDRLKAEVMIASARIERGSMEAAFRWFRSANATLAEIRDPLDQLEALTVLALAYFEANDFQSAEGLLAWSTRGLQSLPGALRKDEVVEAIAVTYASMGLIDEAAGVVRHFYTSTLERDLRLARLARKTAMQGRFLAAEGLLSLVDSEAQKAVTKAQLSVIARYQGQKELADSMAIEAGDHLLVTNGPAKKVAASEVLRAVDRDDVEVFGGLKADAIGILQVVGSESVESAKVVIAKNLAWVGERDAARSMVDSIDDPGKRHEAHLEIQRIYLLGELGDVEVAPAAGVRVTGIGSQ